MTDIAIRAVGVDVEVVHAAKTLDGHGGRAGARQTVLCMVIHRTPDSLRIVSCQNTDHVPGADTHIADQCGIRTTDYR